ncbi:MAG: hypothetical protein PHF00_02880 [Elusimicrobia bacterium]|nr:hypothetical protein [Elusimicrobiota bacterium]
MIKHRLRTRAVPVFWGAAFVFALARAPALAQDQVQLFIDQSFVVKNAGDFCQVSPDAPGQFLCLNVEPMNPSHGVISNQPNIEFERLEDVNGINGGYDCYGNFPANPPRGTTDHNYCNNDVFLCAAIGYNNPNDTSVALDEVSYEVFKFQDGSNPLDPASTPPLRTYFMDAPGILAANSNSTANGVKGPYCILFDGSTNVQGEFGKTNGQYGFRVTVKTNQTGASGNITITAQRAYPAGVTLDNDFVSCTASPPNDGCYVQQKPISVDVTNVHLVRSSATVVGQITGVYAEPYNITYRLSKDATMYIRIHDSNPPFPVIRSLVSGLPRSGEGTPSGTMINGDAWNGRHDNGDLMPPGVYLASLQALSRDQWGRDLSFATTRQLGIDPLQITDIRVQPLLGGSTSLAVLSYMLTEPATVYIEIYPPDTQFCGDALNRIDDPALDTGGLPKNLNPRASDCGGAAVAPIRRISEVKQGRLAVVSFWDGRDEQGNVVCTDGNYVFVMYASLPSQNGKPYGDPPNLADRRIWTSQAKSGLLPVLRGFVGVSQISPGTTVIGSSPAIAGLNPFVFRYSLGREGVVNMKVFDNTGTRLVKTLLQNTVRPGLFANQERWEDAVDDSGFWVGSGTYIAQLTAADPLCPMKVSTVSAQFPVDLFRITDVMSTPLLSGASDTVTLSYQLSQAMNTAWNIYPAGAVIKNSTGTWPPCNSITPGLCWQVESSQGQPVAPLITIKGMRPGRMRITEYWDGRDANGMFVPDGNYVFTLTAQSTTTPKFFASDKIYGSVTVGRGSIIFTSFRVDPDVPALYNSSTTITLHPYTISYALTRQSSVTIQILNSAISPQVVRTVVDGSVREAGLLLEEVWDGRDDRGNFMPSGFYLVRAVAEDVASQLSSGSTAQLTISYDPLRIYDVAVAPLRNDSGGAQFFYQVSETMKVALKIYRPGTVFDPNGNHSPPEKVSLVKRIVGVRPARTEIIETWDGTDLRSSLATDGNYRFKIVGSTDINAIDSLTGNVLNPTALSLDRPIDEIPVVRNESLDPAADFENNTYIYPNPISGDSAHFVIFTPFQAKAKLKVFTMNGDLVLDKEFPETAANTYFNDPLTGFAWDRKNQGGRRLARGVYYALIRVEETLGGKNVLQTVKRFLIK